MVARSDMTKSLAVSGRPVAKSSGWPRSGGMVSTSEAIGRPISTVDPSKSSVTCPPATVFAGLDHLEGRQVIALVDGYAHPPVTVAGVPNS